MNLTIFGATGGTGQQLIKQALTAGHPTVAFVRDPSKLTICEQGYGDVPHARRSG